MRAIHAQQGTPENTLALVEIPEPSPDEGIVIAASMAVVAQPHILQIHGSYQFPKPLPFVPGNEVVGTVDSAPAGSGFAAGDRVIAFVDGAWQEKAVALPGHVFRVPAGLTDAQACGLLVNYVGAYCGLVTRGGSRAGEVLLVHGASGGIGSAAVQLGAALRMRVIAVTSTAEKARYALSIGAAHAVMTATWKDQVQALTDGKGVDVVFDVVGGDGFTDSLRALRPGGRLLVIGFLGGDIPTVKVNRLLLKNISVVGVAAGAYMDAHPGEFARHVQEVGKLIEASSLVLPAPRPFPLANAAAAVDLLRQRHAVGPVALTI
jgi:NADPH2:quinone reductase